MAYKKRRGIGGYNRVLMFHSIRRAVSIFLVLISITLIGWASIPNKRQTVVQRISTSEMQILPTRQGNAALRMPDREVVLEWPDSMRIGEDETITVIFTPVMTDSVSMTQQAGYADVYSVYNLMAEARYTVSGVRVTPANPIRESMPAGRSVKISWIVNAEHPGTYDGTVWLSLRYLPLNGGQASQVPIYIQEVNLQTSSLFGLNETMAYFLGGVGVVLAVVIVYDDLIALIQGGNRTKTTKVPKDTKE